MSIEPEEPTLLIAGAYMTFDIVYMSKLETLPLGTVLLCSSRDLRELADRIDAGFSAAEIKEWAGPGKRKRGKVVQK